LNELSPLETAMPIKQLIYKDSALSEIAVEQVRQGDIILDELKVDAIRKNERFFVIATNDLSSVTSANLLDIYKSQQGVERGLHFLKTPEFIRCYKS